MEQTMSVVTIEDVDREIGRIFPRLRFQPVIERRFIAEYAVSRARLAPLWAIVGLAMYLFQLNDDYNLTPDVFHELLVARLGIFTPGALIGVWLVMRKATAIRYDLMSLWTGVIGSLLPMAIASRTESDHLFAYQNGNVAALMFFVIVLRPRFPVALVGLSLIAAIHAVTMALSGKFDDLTYTSILSFVLTAAVFMAAGAYFLEYIDRMNFLHRLRGSLLQEQLRQSAERDELTGLLNRRSLARIRETLWNGAQGERSLAAIMLDIDRFKLFNDVHGHIEGDACIHAVSRCIADHVGGAGVVFRFGGEEILVLMPDADALKALGVAERVRSAVEALAIRHRGSPDGQFVTVSLGVACGRPADSSLEDLLKMADDALYQAKRRGRNTVLVSDSGPHAQPSVEPESDPDTIRLSRAG